METQRRFPNAGPSLPELVRSYAILFRVDKEPSCHLRLGLNRAMLPHPRHPSSCPWMDDFFHKRSHRLILNHYRMRQYLLCDPAISRKCCKRPARFFTCQFISKARRFLESISLQSQAIGRPLANDRDLQSGVARGSDPFANRIVQRCTSLPRGTT